MMIIPATYIPIFSPLLYVVCLVGVKTTSFLFIKINRVIVTQVGFCVVSQWPYLDPFQTTKRHPYDSYSYKVLAHSFKGFTLWAGQTFYLILRE